MLSKHKITYMDIKMPFNAFEPFIDEKSNFIHYEYHYKKYVDNSISLLEKNPIFENLDLEESIIKSYEDIEFRDTFNQLAQVWNHEFWWKSLTPINSEDCKMPTIISENINNSFGNIDNFYKKILEEASKIFGSGWLWIVSNKDNNIDIITTTNAFNPLLIKDIVPLLCIDVWEHAYYLQYNHNKIIFIKQILNLMNWNFAERNFLSNLPSSSRG